MPNGWVNVLVPQSVPSRGAALCMTKTLGYTAGLVHGGRLIFAATPLLSLALKILVELLRFKTAAGACFGANITGLSLNPGVCPSPGGAISTLSVYHSAGSLSLSLLQGLYV